MLMVVLLAVASGLGYFNLTTAASGIQEAKRLSSFSTTSSNLVADLHNASSLIFNFLDNPEEGKMVAARKELEQAIQHADTCSTLVKKPNRVTALQEIRKAVQDGLRLEEKIRSGVMSAKNQYSDSVKPGIDALTAKMLQMGNEAKKTAAIDELHAILTVVAGFSNTRATIGRYSVSRLPAEGKLAAAELATLEGAIKNINAHAASEATKRNVADLLTAYSSILNAFATMQARYTEVNNELDNITKLLNSVLTSAASLSDEVDVEAAQISSTLEANTLTASKLNMALGAFGLILGSACAFVNVSGIIRVLNELSHFAVAVSKGDFTTTANIREKGEIGDMLAALQNIPNVLKQIAAAYSAIEKDIENGKLDTQGDASQFSGEFANLVRGTNNVLARFRLVIDSIPSPVLTLNREMRLIFMNKSGQLLCGDGYKNQHIGEVFNADDRGTPADALQKALTTQGAASGDTRIHPRGQTLEITYNSIPMTDTQGNLACVLQLVTDISQIRQTQRTIMDVAAQALDISNRVAAASEELSTQVEQVSRGTDVQRDRAASTATAMEEMNATVLEVARNAGQASEQAENTRTQAEYGADMVNKVIAAIRQVNIVATELQSNMQDLGKQAESIGGVMNVISDIADQTNLLALNAAIEAARAGEAGRGFAVVADEVRKLAEKTMGATTEVGSSIRGIQASATSNITRVGDAAKSIGEATELAGTSGSALQEILKLAANNSSLIAGIATAAEEQSATSDEINHSIDEVNRIAGETASGMAESSAAVQELSHMAQELKVLLDKLQTR